MLAHLGFNRSMHSRHRHQLTATVQRGNTTAPNIHESVPTLNHTLRGQYRFSSRASESMKTMHPSLYPAFHVNGVEPKSQVKQVSSEFVGLKALSAPTLHHRAVGELNQADTVATPEGDRRWDEYTLPHFNVNDRVHVRLNSDAFDPLLQLVNASTGEVLASNDDRDDHNSRLTFRVQPDVDYRLHITSYSGEAMGQYAVETTHFVPKTMKNFNFDYGYGLVDTAAAVAEAAGAELFKNGPTSWSDKTWAQDTLGLSSIWKQNLTGKDITVAVVDTGVQLEHSELKGNLWRNAEEIAGNGKDDDGNGFVDDVRGWNFADNNADVSDTRDHGSHIAGIIAANHQGEIKGVAYDAKIMPIKVVGESGGSQDQVAQGIRYAVKNGADVINISLGADPGSLMSSKLKRAIRFAHKKEVAVVVASGNERQLLGATQAGEPAHYTAQNALGIVVGAMDQTHTVAEFSNPTGNKRAAFVTAPGTNIFSLSSQDASGYKWRQGTSMAAAYVSGVVALMLEANPELTPQKIIRILTKTASQTNITAM